MFLLLGEIYLNLLLKELYYFFNDGIWLIEFCLNEFDGVDGLFSGKSILICSGTVFSICNALSVTGIAKSLKA